MEGAGGGGVGGGDPEDAGEALVIAGEGLVDPPRLRMIHQRIEHRTILRHVHHPAGGASRRIPRQA